MQYTLAPQQALDEPPVLYIRIGSAVGDDVALALSLGPREDVQRGTSYIGAVDEGQVLRLAACHSVDAVSDSTQGHQVVLVPRAVDARRQEDGEGEARLLGVVLRQALAAAVARRRALGVVGTQRGVVAVDVAVAAEATHQDEALGRLRQVDEG